MSLDTVLRRGLAGLALLGVLAAGPAFAAGSSGIRYLDARVNLEDQTSLQRGAKLFVNYCLSCHSAEYMRYNRVGKDLGLTDQQVTDNLMFTSDKLGSPMLASMSAEDGNVWFGKAPPDLSVIARARGADWLYTYLMTFYQDDSRPNGVNNLVFKDVGMPHVLGNLQGVQVLRDQPASDGAPPGARSVNEMLELKRAGTLNAAEYRTVARDLTNFLVYMGEPAKLVRYKVGFWVLVFLAVFYLLARAMYKEYWRDVH